MQVVEGTITIYEETPMRLTVLATALGIAAAATGQSHAQDAAAGEKVFAKCKACHVVDQDQNKVGPSLMGVVGRTAGTHPGFKFSPAMVKAGQEGLVWDDAKLTEYLRNPRGMIKGGKMAFPGLKKDDELANVIAYLKQFSQPKTQ
jgi:cytochrome c